jgi:hypothetical protein
MNLSSFYHSSALLIAACSLLYSCSGDTKKEPVQPVPAEASVPPVVNQPPAINTENLTVKTFEVKDSTSGKSLGWGYDIIFSQGGKIHQPSIPAVQGIQYFSSEEKAKRTGDFAASKMQRYGGLTGLTIEELDSLGVIK